MIKSSENSNIKVLWLAPNFNHYKARFLNHLANEADVLLTILSGSGRDQMGDQELQQDWSFKQVKVNVSKKEFGNSKVVKQQLNTIFKNFDWVLVPAEKKNLPLFLFAMRLRKENKSVRLFSYNHEQLKSKNKLFGLLDNSLTKFFYKKLDRIIFYTENACKEAVDKKIIKKDKAFWANNTVDNTEIEKYYRFQFPPENQQTILFIGRLIPSKRISDLITYYKLLKQNYPNLKLEIIGDGPQKDLVVAAIEKDSSIIWHGTLVDENLIAPIMKRASFVFIPGLSGLSIIHAFAYGRPYVTLEADKHGPEISYLEEGKNGCVLSEGLQDNMVKISQLLENRDLLVEFCNNANAKGDELSIQKWVQQIKASLLHD